jgi:SAM-dependent methyltransferase
VLDSSYWDNKYAQADSLWSLEPNEFVREALADLPVGRMVDIAGGEGRNALWFASRGWQAENVDFSQVALDKFLARATAAELLERVTATRADASTPAVFTLAPVDLVLIAYLQIPEDALAATIANAAEQLARGGQFFAVWHARENLERGFGGPQDPAVLPTQAQVRHMLGAAGLQLDSLELRERHLNVDGTPRVALDIVARAIRT